MALGIFDRLSQLLLKDEPKFDDKSDELKDGVVLKNSDEPEAIEFNMSNVVWGFDYEIRFKTIADLITLYRAATIQFEIADAVDEITNEAIIKEDNPVVELDLDDTKLSDKIKKKIVDEFDYIVQLLNFNNEGDYFFRRWYIDGRIYLQAVIDQAKEAEGIKDLNILSPYDLVRVKLRDEFKEEKKVEDDYAYLYKYNSRRLDGCANVHGLNSYKYQDQEGYIISEHNIIFVPSGLTDYTGKFYISYLHKALKPLNQLRLIEDSAVIYRITRAPERRVFFIDVGRLSKKKADAYVKKVINNFKTKVYYDSQTGQMSTKKNVMTMLNDYYLPTNSDSKGTRVETLEGGSQLGEIEDIKYFKKKLYKSLNVPLARVDEDDNPTVELGRSGELTRQELKFTKFIKNLRYRFGHMFLDALEIQLVLKNVINAEEWDEIKNLIRFIWNVDNYWDELKQSDIWKERLELADSMTDYIGTDFSREFLRKQVFKMTDEDIKEQEKLINAEAEAGELDGEVDDDEQEEIKKKEKEEEKPPVDKKQKEDDEDEDEMDDEKKPEPKPKKEEDEKE